MKSSPCPPGDPPPAACDESERALQPERQTERLCRLGDSAPLEVRLQQHLLVRLAERLLPLVGYWLYSLLV